MRLLRLLALAAAVALVYFAQYLFDHGTLADFYPGWLLTFSPALRRTTRWLPADLLAFAQWLSVIGLLGFGLLSPMWTGETNRLYRRMRLDMEAERRPWRLATLILLAAAVILAGVSAFMLGRGPEPRWLWGVWLAGVLAYLGASYALNRATPGVTYARRYVEHVRPWQNWQGVAVLLVILALLYTFDLRDLPARVDTDTAETGLQVQRLLHGEAVPFLGGDGAARPRPALILTLVTTWLARDALMGARLAGTIAGLVMVVSTWLAATELFRRAPHQGEFGEIFEDDGRWVALMAALLAGVGVAVYHFARLPIHFEGVALGTLSLWAMLRGLRTDRPWLLGVSGLCLGWVWYYGLVGLSFTLVVLAAWCGVVLLERGWLTGKAVLVRDGPAVPVQQGAGWTGFGLWLAGVAVVAAPLLGLWIGHDGELSHLLTWQAAGVNGAGVASVSGGPPAWAQLGARLRLTLLGLNQLPDQSGLISVDQHLLPSLLAPLLVLAVGSLLLNMDTLMGWIIVTWLGSALAAAAITTPAQPFWPAMLPLLPAAGLAVAYVIDRLRVLVMETLGTWTLQATVYLALGVAVAAGMFSWIVYYQAAHNDGDLASVVGRAADIGEEVQLVVVNGQEELGRFLTQPVVRLLAGEARAAQAIQVQAGTWPERLPSPARVLVAPADVGLIPTLHALYPDGQWQVERNLNATPILYVYDLPAEP